MKYLVTGGAGFIGSNIVHELVRRGEEVVVLDNLSTGKLENIKDVLSKITFIQGDLLDYELTKKACQDVDYVLHQAALPSVPKSIANPMTSHMNNSTATLKLLLAARDSGVKRVVYAASSSAYGEAVAEYKTETIPAMPISPYGLEKYAGEVYAKLFYNLYGLETVSLRYFNVFGPHQNPHSEYAAVIPKFIKLMLAGKSPTIYGDGTQSRDFTFVLNNVNANILAATSKKGAGETINIACGNSVTLNELVDLINEYLGTDIKPIYIPANKGDIKHSKADIHKAKELLGYVPKKSFVNGLHKTIEWYKSHSDIETN